MLIFTFKNSLFKNKIRSSRGKWLFFFIIIKKCTISYATNNTKLYIWISVEQFYTKMCDYFLIAYQVIFLCPAPVLTHRPLYSLQLMPPVTVIVSPVMYEASSEHKKAITPPMSSGFPNLRANHSHHFYIQYYIRLKCSIIFTAMPLNFTLCFGVWSDDYGRMKQQCSVFCFFLPHALQLQYKGWCH